MDAIKHNHRISPELLDRKPPSDEESERALLGSLLLDPKRFDEVTVSEADFHVEANAIIYRAMQSIRKDGGGIDSTTVAGSLKQTGQWQEVGAGGYIATLLESSPTSAHAAHYASRIRDRAMRRQALRAAEETLQGVYNGQSTSSLLSGAASRFASISDQHEHDAGATFNRITCKELATTNYAIKWLIDGILVAGQPCGIIGPKKALKTSIALDMAVALAMGGHFLGRFPVEQAHRVAFFSGESGLSTLQETSFRICDAAHVNLADTGIIFSDTLPQLASSKSLDALRRFLVDDEIEVLFIDPLYLCLDTGGNEGSIFTMGPLLRNVADLCISIGVTPILLHHMKSIRERPNKPGTLDDASWSGMAEFLRQWILLTRQREYDPGSGGHDLWLSVGGSAGHSSLWGVNVREGVYDPDKLRVWDVDVVEPDEAGEAAQEQQDAAKMARVQEQLDRDMAAIVQAAIKYPDGETKTTLHDMTGLNSKRFAPAFANLLQDKTIIGAEITKGNGRVYDAYKVNPNSEI